MSLLCDFFAIKLNLSLEKKSRMSITIVEGCDLAGKTTFCMSEIEKLAPSQSLILYVHFPIRQEADIQFHIPGDFGQNKYRDMFTFCKPLSVNGIPVGSAEHIQDIIFANIVVNSEPIWKLYKLGFTIFIDRYIHSNIVYRKLNGCRQVSKDSLPDDDILSKIRYAVSIMVASKLIVIVHDDQTLIDRHMKKDSSRGIDELDRENEQLKNILNANNLYRHVSVMEF